MNWDWIKENWFLIALGAAGLVGYMELRLNQIAETDFGDKIAAIEAVKPETITAMNDKITANTKYIEKTEDKVERIVQILLED